MRVIYNGKPIDVSFDILSVWDSRGCQHKNERHYADSSSASNTIMEAVGFSGGLAFDASKPDGTPRKLLDVSKLKIMGWSARISVMEGIIATYRDYLCRAH